MCRSAPSPASSARPSIGDRIRSRFEVTDIRPRGEGYLILRHCELKVEGAARPALVADWWALVLPVS
jgi:hypothetical protein